MALGSGARVIKTCLFITNTLCLIMGFACLIVSSIIFIKRGNINNLPEGIDSYSLGYLLLIVGLITLVFSSLGTYGTWREVFWIIMSYAFLLFCLVFVQTFVVGYTIHHKNDFVQDLEKFMHEEFGNGTHPTTNVDEIQRKYMCCGIDGPKFWNETIPASCCKGDGAVKCEVENAFNRGCLAVLTLYYLKIKNYFCGVSLGLILFEIFALISSTFLAREIRHQNRMYEQLR